MNDDISVDCLSISITRSDRSKRISSLILCLGSIKNDVNCLSVDDNGNIVEFIEADKSNG